MALAFSPKRSLVVALVITGVLLLIPARHLGVLNWFRRLTITLVAPVSHPIQSVSRWLTPGGTAPNSDPQTAALQARLDESQTALLRAQRENERLRSLLEEARVLTELNPTPATHIVASVFASSSDLSSPVLRVRAGTRQGVDTNTVATVRGEQLLGRVTGADDSACTVLPITSKAAGPIKGLVMVERNGSQFGLACTLEQSSDGSLRGPVEDRRDQSGSPTPNGGTLIEPTVGLLVRLDDPDRWPQHAQMLVVGKVERVDPSPSQPLRKIITVRPVVDQMERSRRVALRAPKAPDAAPARLRPDTSGPGSGSGVGAGGGEP